MNQPHRDTMLTFAACFTVGIGTWSAWVWWYYRDVERFDRPWYAMLPVLNVVVGFLLGAAVGWLWTRGKRS